MVAESGRYGAVRGWTAMPSADPAATAVPRNVLFPHGCEITSCAHSRISPIPASPRRGTAIRAPLAPHTGQGRYSPFMFGEWSAA